MATSDRLRETVYRQYITGRATCIAPEGAAGFSSRLPFLKRLVKLLPADRKSRILDLGCGHGAFLYALTQCGYTEVMGVDGSAEQVARACALGVGNVVDADLETYVRTAPNGTWDAVVLFDVLEHFSKAKGFALLVEVRRCLRDGGTLLVHAPNTESPFGPRILFWDITHETAFTRESVTQLLLAAGFEHVECFEASPTVHGPVSLVRWVLWQVISAAWHTYLAIETGSFERNAIFTQNFVIRARAPKARRL